MAEGRTTTEAPALERLGRLAGNRAVAGFLAGAGRPASASSHLEAEARAAATLVPAGIRASVAGRAAPGVVQLSPMSDRLEDDFKSGKDYAHKLALMLHRLRTFGPAANDLHTSAFLAKVLKGKSPDDHDYWLATTIQMYGKQPFWPAKALEALHTRSSKSTWKHRTDRDQAVLDEVTSVLPKKSGVGTETVTMPIRAWYFQGTTAERVLVVGGFHGTERAGIEVAERLCRQLADAKGKPYYTTIVVPTLYPLNAERGRRLVKAGKKPGFNEERWVRDEKGKVRPADPKAGTGQLDPNRTLPPGGKALSQTLDPTTNVPVDAKGRPMPPETVALVRLIERFKPSRIASVHGVHAGAAGGFFADPDTEAKKKATDPKVRAMADEARRLSLAMALRSVGVSRQDAFAGAADTSRLMDAVDLQKARDKAAQALAKDPSDPKKKAAVDALAKKVGVDATLAKERVRGNKLLTGPTADIGGEPGIGTSLGGYGPAAGMAVVTVEITGNTPTDEMKPGAARDKRADELEAEATAVNEMFLGKGP